MQDHRALVGDQGLELRGKNIELAGARQRHRVVGQRSDRHVFHGFFHAHGAGGLLDVHGFGVTGEAVGKPPIILCSRTHGGAPPLMGNGVGEKPVVDFFGDGPARHTHQFGRPYGGMVSSGNSTTRSVARERPEGSDVVSELFERGRCVFGRELLVERLEEDMQIDAGVVALGFLEHTGDDRARETGAR